MSMRARLPAYVAAIMLTACAANAPRLISSPTPTSNGDLRSQIKVGGLTRRYTVHVPLGGGAGSGRPVVFLFHGQGGNGVGMEWIAHFDSTSDHNGFLAVYPDGFQGTWNDGRGTTAAEKAKVDDVAFVSAMIDRLAADYKIDRARVFATGLSNGGMFSERLGCQLAGTIAAIAPVAGPLPADLSSSCRSGLAVPVLEIHGTSDPLIPYTGGQLKAGLGDVLSARATFATWRARDACPREPVTTQLPRKPSDPTTTTVQTSSGCKNGSLVALYTVNGGGHTWPGGALYLPVRLIGPVTRTFDASQTIWDFFASVPRA
jgi:polyhydroxybutyrate depolymerase